MQPIHQTFCGSASHQTRFWLRGKTYAFVALRLAARLGDAGKFVGGLCGDDPHPTKTGQDVSLLAKLSLFYLGLGIARPKQVVPWFLWSFNMVFNPTQPNLVNHEWENPIVVGVSRVFYFNSRIAWDDAKPFSTGHGYMMLLEGSFLWHYLT